MARRSQLLFLVLLLTSVGSVLAQDLTAVFTTPSGTLTAGGRASLWLFCMNNSSNSVHRTFAPSLNCTLAAQSVTFETVLLLNTNSSPSAATIAPGGFVREEYLLDLPLTSSGQVTLDVSGYNQLMILVESGSSETPVVASAPAPDSRLHRIQPRLRRLPPTLICGTISRTTCRSMNRSISLVAAPQRLNFRSA